MIGERVKEQYGEATRMRYYPVSLYTTILDYFVDDPNYSLQVGLVGGLAVPGKFKFQNTLESRTLNVWVLRDPMCFIKI